MKSLIQEFGAGLVLMACLVVVAGCSGSGSSSGSPDNGSEPAPEPTVAPEPVASCAQEAPEALRRCIGAYAAAVGDCYGDTDAACAGNDATLNGALATLESDLRESCTDGEFLTLSTDAVVGRLKNSCASEASSMAWRTFGGPQGAVWPNVDGDAQACLAAAYRRGTTFVDETLAEINGCLAEGGCDASGIAAERAAKVAAAVSDIEASCADLSSLIALTPATYVARAAQQIDCITATGQTDPEPVELNCGPTNAEFEAPRGEYIQVIVDGDKWGSLCGDGSDFAFQIRLAPEGAPLDRILIGLQGGGVCVFGADCSARFAGSPGLFNAQDDVPLGAGIASDDPEISPFADWTKVYVPYCNQDVFTGGGVIEEFEEISVPRFGGMNLRAAVQMTRDLIWKMMDEEGGAGFRPDEIRALVGGWSAGGYGTIFNYHWFLDDLLWPRTAAFPDAGLALDNGELLGVRGLGEVKIPAWGVLQNLPPYCFVGSCAIGPTLYASISPRLKQVPEQQFLILSNPKDYTQQNDAYFDDEVLWHNTFRQSYCDTKDLKGINYYFTSESERSIHVVSLREEFWLGEVDGEVMADWFLRAMTEPDTIENRVEEGDFVSVIPGVEPYPCEVAP